MVLAATFFAIAGIEPSAANVAQWFRSWVRGRMCRKYKFDNERFEKLKDATERQKKLVESLHDLL
jgi:hypothetical protein